MRRLALSCITLSVAFFSVGCGGENPFIGTYKGSWTIQSKDLEIPPWVGCWVRIYDMEDSRIEASGNCSSKGTPALDMNSFWTVEDHEASKERGVGDFVIVSFEDIHDGYFFDAVFEASSMKGDVDGKALTLTAKGQFAGSETSAGSRYEFDQAATMKFVGTGGKDD